MAATAYGAVACEGEEQRRRGGFGHPPSIGGAAAVQPAGDEDPVPRRVRLPRGGGAVVSEVRTGYPATVAAVEIVPWNLIRLRPAEGGATIDWCPSPDAFLTPSGYGWRFFMRRPFLLLPHTQHPVLEGVPMIKPSPASAAPQSSTVRRIVSEFDEGYVMVRMHSRADA